jgi:N-acetyl-gamma-glutamyl-phosphate reductase
MGATASVLGASGFTGGEIVRLLATHPAIELGRMSADARVGEPLAPSHPHLAAVAERRLCSLQEALSAGGDVCFSCLPAGELRAAIDRVTADIVVDIAGDFRAPGAASEWVYGLTEFAHARVASSTRIANPGCYPTAALLSLVPFARAGVIDGPVVIDALSGLTGAGRKGADHLMFAPATESSSAYGTTHHRHVPEIERGLASFGDLTTTVSFTPHLVPMARGLLVTARARPTREITDGDAQDLLREAFASEPFVHVVAEWPATKAVSGSNHAHVSARVDSRSGWLIASAAIDNLGKGAAGQAMQNANLALGLDETAGLEHTGVWP